MKLLILGGTSEAKSLAKKLLKLDIEIIYSLAGLVRLPELNCEIISGGFSQLGGLSEYLLSKDIDCILDATHPFATNMSRQAQCSAADMNIPYYSFVRPEWQPQVGDNWLLAEDPNQLLNDLALAVNTGSQNVFYTNGQIDRNLAVELDAIAELNETFGPARYIVRSAKETELPQYAHWLQAIGPFNLADEKALMKEYEVDLIVCKNSGGEATKAKLEAARELSIRVLMLQRPKLADEAINSMNRQFNNLDECFEFINEKCSSDL
jgi:precorrin-6A/cobalt-precorrin-6A reductase